MLWGIWVVALVRGDREDAGQMAALFQRLIETSEDPTTRVVLHAALGAWNFWRGAYAEALRHCNLAKELLQQEQSLENPGAHPWRRQPELLLRAGALRVPVQAFSETMLGNIGRAREAYQEALALAEAMQHPYAVALTLSFCASIEYEVGEPEAARDLANRLIAISAGNGFLFTLAIGYCVLGWATARLGDAPSGNRDHPAGPRAHPGHGRPGHLPHLPGVSAQGISPGPGRYAEGLAAAKEGLEMLETLLPLRARPDLLRLQGEFLLRQGETEAARASLEQALAEARELRREAPRAAQRP